MSTDGESPDRFIDNSMIKRPIFNEHESLVTGTSRADIDSAISTDGDSSERVTETKRRIFDDNESLQTMASISNLKISKLSPSLKDIFSDMNSIDFNPSVAAGIHVPNQEHHTITLDSDSDERLKSFINKVIEKEFPTKSNIPSVRDVINIGNTRKSVAKYEPGTWVEIEGPDMKWRLNMITGSIKEAPDDWDWNNSDKEDKEPPWVYYYHAGSDRRFREEDVRSPEEGLKRVFGNRPWIWQQWAMLKLEEKIRFQEGHQHDCIEMDVQKYGADLWDQWLEHESNLEFKNAFNDDRVGNVGRSELLNHIQTPFHLIDRLSEDTDEWRFDDDANISVFTYMSLLGAGVITPLIVFLIQIFIPIIFFKESSEEIRCSLTDGGEESVPYTRLMSLMVFVLYIITVLQDHISRIYDVEGAADSVYSRLLSLRRQTWEQGDDTIIQMIGFKLDIVMSTGYESILSIFNVFLILNTNQALEVLLNALAFVFIAKIDEEIVKSSWYDPQNRWITAGTIEVVMANTIRFRSLASPSLFSAKYGVARQSLIDACGEDENLFKNREVADSDAEDVKYLTNEERVLHLFRDVAKERGNMNALDEYRKPMKYFSRMGPLFGYLGITTPIFMTFKAFRTWSRWNEVLYLAPVPDLDTLFDDEADGDGQVLSSMLHDIKPTKARPFANFYPLEEGLSNRQLLARQIVNVLKNDLPRGLKSSFRQGRDHKVLRSIVHILGYSLSVMAYTLQIAFPIFLAYAIGGTIHELLTKKCFFTWW